MATSFLRSRIMSVFHFRIPVLLTLAALTAGALVQRSAAAASLVSHQAVQCDPDNGGISLPEGFCAVVFADELGRARHLDVGPNGDVFVALRDVRNRDGTVEPGAVVVLRDTDGDGRADLRERWGERGANEVLLRGEHLYFAPDDAVLRYRIDPGSMTPSGPPDTIVRGLPAVANHTAKSLAVDDDGFIYVNIGSPSNACMTESRVRESPGQDPCPELETRAGIWRFTSDRLHQEQADGTRFATGMRNTVGLRFNPETGTLFGVIHGRDSLSELWPELFTTEQRVEKPSEEFVTVSEGDHYGWPYCYHDPETGAKVLAPEYGGDGSQVGRCSDMAMPLIGFPAHWAPNDLEFYTGTQFPGPYRGGAFIAFHGSWNRSPAPQAGYNVVFVPMEGDRVTGDWQVFADGFAGEDVSPRGATYRPVGVAMAPDGSLFISDSQKGRIWKVSYAGR
jgi:glucose/arabinose dehydrogenase